jgi:hypothetical protein
MDFGIIEIYGELFPHLFLHFHNIHFPDYCFLNIESACISGNNYTLHFHTISCN